MRTLIANPVRLAAIALVIAMVTIGLLPNVSLGQTTEGNTELRAQASSLRTEIQSLVAAGRLDEAISKSEHLVEIGRALFGENHPTVETLLQDLADLYVDVGRDADAKRVRAEASQIGQRNPSIDIDVEANLLIAAGKNRFDRGDMANAWKSYMGALKILENKGSTYRLQQSVVIGELGRVLEERKLFDDAEEYYRLSALGAEGVGDSGLDQASTALNNLGNLYWKLNRLDEATHALERSLKMTEKLFDPKNPSNVPALVNLGRVYGDKGDMSRAQSLYQQARDITISAFGKDHHLLATVYNNMASAAWTEGDAHGAVKWQEKANRVTAKNIADNVLLGSERQKHLYMLKFVEEGNASISLSLSLAKGMQRAGRMAFHALLQRKGRVMDTLVQSMAEVRQSMSESDRRLLDEFVALQREKSALVYSAGKSNFSQPVPFDAARADRLQVLLGQRNSDFRDIYYEVNLEAVYDALPPGSALVEFVVYTPRRPTRETTYFASDPPRYAVFVLSASGEIAWLDLAEETTINRLVLDFRSGLADPKRTYVKQIAQRLYESIMEDVWPHVKDADRIFVAPDGALNLVPFGALVDGEGNYLVTQTLFNYVSSGRDLLREVGTLSPKEYDVIVADPDYGKMKDGSNAPCTDNQRRSARSMSEGFSRLCGTGLEASEIAKQLQQPTLLLGRDATEEAVKQLDRPRILHLATHGFYDSELLSPTGSAVATDHSTDSLTNLDQVLLSSGIVLAGVNQRRSGIDDGILTALETVALNLNGTELVVLSACETGVGEVVAGEGVFGMRRALMLAGAESQLLSLWKVSDEITARLMARYYEQLIVNRKGRADALNSVQEELLTESDSAHPYYWASFILSGNWRPLSFPSH